MALRDITLGQYFPGNSALHRLDPRTKLIFVFVYVVALFVANSFLTYGLMFVLLCQGIALSRVPLKQIFKGMKPLVMVVLITGVLNIFVTPGEVVLWEYAWLSITEEGLTMAVFMVFRILLLVTGSFLLTYTTSPMVLTDGLEYLMGPMKKIGVPVHDLSMMMSIALRFVPTLIEESDKILSAQKARGADFESGNVFQRAKGLVPLFVPLFVSALRRADELADGMDCRCYHGGEGRTKMKPLKYGKGDFLALAYFMLVVAVMFGFAWGLF